jgi:tRNA threonylcarbamoyladenosine biosynthesis protein TsaE
MKTCGGAEPLTLTTVSPAGTRELGRRLGSLLGGEEVIHLVGGLGAGKTLLVQGLALGLGIPEEIRPVSPTFTLINEYPGPVPLFHVDLYRLERPEEIRQLGLEDYFGEGVVAIEWAERLPAELARRDLEVRLQVLSPRRRRITVTGDDLRPGSRLWELLRRLPG